MTRLTCFMGAIVAVGAFAPLHAWSFTGGQLIESTDGRHRFCLEELLGGDMGVEVWRVTELPENVEKVAKFLDDAINPEVTRSLVRVYAPLWAAYQSEPTRLSHLQVYQPLNVRLPGGKAGSQLLTQLQPANLQSEIDSVYLFQALTMGRAEYSRRLSVIQALWRDGLAALAQLQELGVVHSDMNPDNWFMTGQLDDVAHGQAGFRLADFDFSGPPGRQVFGFNPSYAAPELVTCNPNYGGYEHSGSKNFYTDHFGFASVLYETIFGPPPYMHYTLKTIVPAAQLQERDFSAEQSWSVRAARSPDQYFPDFLQFVDAQLNAVARNAQPLATAAQTKAFGRLHAYILAALQPNEAARGTTIGAKLLAAPVAEKNSRPAGKKCEKRLRR